MDECSQIDTDDERKLMKKIVESRKRISTSFNKEQETAFEEHIDLLYDINAIFARKAFIKGCEFAVSFMSESNGSINKNG